LRNTRSFPLRKPPCLCYPWELDSSWIDSIFGTSRFGPDRPRRRAPVHSYRWEITRRCARAFARSCWRLITWRLSPRCRTGQKWSKMAALGSQIVECLNERPLHACNPERPYTLVVKLHSEISSERLTYSMPAGVLRPAESEMDTKSPTTVWTKPQVARISR